jgi:hypothetical protein
VTLFGTVRAVALLITVAQPMAAQSAQPYAAQISALFTTIRAGGASLGGTGVELQQRFSRVYATETFGALSIGIGGQYTVHAKVKDRLNIAGIFVEPRWVPATGSSKVFPYLSARIAFQRLAGDFQFADDGSANGSALGAGGGLAVRVTRMINLDAGVQLVRQQFGSIGVLTFRPFTTYNAKIGASFGYPR